MIFSCFSPLDMSLNYIYIDGDRYIFILPFIHHPITWYGVLFAFSFCVGYFLTKFIIKKYLLEKSFNSDFANKKSLLFADRILIFIVLGAILGARIGHIFFYDWSFYKNHPLEILKLWEGGLASHGAILGIFLSIYLFIKTNKKNFSFLSFIFIVDVLVIPAAFAGGCIRIGNFINQEILGKPTQLPWGTIFGHPAQKIEQIPLHPVQIYESLAYFSAFFFLFWLWKKRKYQLGDGINSAFFFLWVFGFRFFIEFLKLPQSDFYDGKHALNMGQILSIPFILAGCAILIYHFFAKKNKNSHEHK